MKSWVLSEDILEIADGEKRIPASVNQVYESVIENMPAWTDLASGKTGHAKDLKFSRYPVNFFLLIAEDTVTGKPILSIRARTQQGTYFPVSIKALTRGHVVYEGTWYPGVPGNTEAVVSLLDQVGNSQEIGMTCTLKGLLQLKKVAVEGGPVIDELRDVSLKHFCMAQDLPRGPENIHANLYPYQINGWQWLSFIIREQLGGLLADEMGLGKTLQVISALRDPGGKGAINRSLVIAPGSLLENWIREINKFCPDLKAFKHQGVMRTGSPTDLKRFDVIVTSYDTVIRDLSLFKMVEWNAVILDEAQNIRNPEAMRTKAVKQIERKASLAVTGTPVENRLRDLWSIMDFILPGYLGDQKSFEARFDDELNAAASLEPIISPLMLRRRVADVAKDLPPRIDIPEFLEMSEKEASVYDFTRKSILDKYGKAASLVSLGKLRQFCAHPAIVENSKYGADVGFSKFERLKELMEEIFSRNEKALVFTSYTKMADLIAEMAEKECGVMAVTLDGRVAIEERQNLLDRFSLYDGPAVMILNPRAGGSGLNITAANHVIHYNPEWNPALEDQASARAYRRGQQRPVTVRRLIYTNTVEEVISERLLRKRDIAEAAVIGVVGGREDYEDIVAALERTPYAANAGQR